MSTTITVPSLGESVSEATVARWFKNPGDAVKKDEPICELETDKVTLEVPSSAAGVLSEIKAAVGSNVEVGAALAVIAEGMGKAASGETPKAANESAPAKAEAPKAAAAPAKDGAHPLPPAAQKLVTENNLNVSAISGTGKDGRITKEDVMKHMEGGAKPASGGAAPALAVVSGSPSRTEERVRMTTLRRRIAQRLKESQNTAAILSTFNEIDMTNVTQLRAEYKDAIEKKHGIRLGFMGFFVKAAVQALKEIPAVNAQIDGDDVIYKNYYDIGVAVGTPQGLVVPVIRNAESKSLIQIEAEIAALAKKARDGKLTMEELTGGTFTVSNGGVYGSLMSTPIINPPQSGILGMHKTMDRPVAMNGQVVIRPMMYIALSYDHRIIDGSESVTFLKRVKENVEDPRRLLLDV
jgi:2-oxoglutarate dehydrogenase E2 component (dihydrolipoamide succinyltransferase)